MEGPIIEHGYPGRHERQDTPLRISDLRNSADMAHASSPEPPNGGLRVVVTTARKHVCHPVPQNWGFCNPEQRRWYLEKLHPVLLEGIHYLGDNPRETNCYSLRFVDRKDDSWGAMEQSFGLGFATDVHAFEQWAKSHPTHLAIFDGFLNMVDTFGADLQLRLWHEVTALPGSGCEFEYIGCHPGTGLLCYA